jgi:alpha-glucosidase (family GH31 glycosyl hydrolase)
VYLPRGNDWIDLDTGVRHAGGTLLSRRVDLATLPHFGRVGYVLPLGRAIDRVDAMNVAAPLDEVWAFGPVAHERRGFTQLRHTMEDGTLDVHCDAGTVRRF